MSDTYVTLKVKEALKSGQGSRAQAMRLLVAMALTDEQLLRGLCKPYLPAICGGAVDRLFRGQPMPSAAAPARSGPAKQPVKRKLTPQMLDAVISRMGQPAPAEPTRRAASFGPEFGQDFDSPSDDETAQADSLKTLAKAFRQR